MVVASGPVIIDIAGVMERSGSFGDPHRRGQQLGGPPATTAPPMYYYPQQPYYGYPPQPQQHHRQPAPVQPYPAGMPPFQAPGYPQQVWYGPPQYVGPPPGAVHGVVELQQAQHGYTQPRPVMRPPGLVPAGMMPLPMQSPGPAPRFQQERAPTPRGRFLIPGNGVRSSSTSSVKRGSTGSTVRSLSDDVTDQQRSTSAATEDMPETSEASVAPPSPQQQKDDSNAHAPCAFFLRTGTCAYGSRCKFQHASPTTSMAMLNSLGLPLRPGQPECQFYTKHMRCGFGASCKYHHPEPQGHQWQMVSQAPYLYPQPGVMPYLPAMPPPPLLRSTSGYSERCPQGVAMLSTRALSSVPSFDDQTQTLPQGGSTRRRSRLSNGGRGSRGGDASLPLPQPAAQPMPSPPVVPPAPVLLPSGDDIIVHEAVEQPLLFGDLPAAGDVIAPASGSEDTADGPDTDLDIRQLAVAALLPAEQPNTAAGTTVGGLAANFAAQPPATAATQRMSPKTIHQIEGKEAGADRSLSCVAAPPAALGDAVPVSSNEVEAPGAATLVGTPSDPSAPATASDMPWQQLEAAARLQQLACAPEPPAARAALKAARADALAEEMDRLEVESSDGSYCSAASQSGSQQA